MTPGQIRKTVENYPDYLVKREQLQKRLINLAGRDPEQEAVLLHRLEEIEVSLEIIDGTMENDSILTAKESYAVFRRVEGTPVSEIANIFGYTVYGTHLVLKSAYKKIAQVVGEILCIA